MEREFVLPHVSHSKLIDILVGLLEYDVGGTVIVLMPGRWTSRVTNCLWALSLFGYF
jgi:hypothetical protein